MTSPGRLISCLDPGLLEYPFLLEMELIEVIPADDEDDIASSSPCAKTAEDTEGTDGFGRYEELRLFFIRRFDVVKLVKLCEEMP